MTRQTVPATPSEHEAGEGQMARVRTGNPQVDSVLGGGFPRHSLNLVMGQPGTGKTIFAEQLLFANANGGRPLLFATTLSEPLAKVVTYAQQLEFFDASKVGSSIRYEDIGALLATEGPAGLVPWLTDQIVALRPAIIVIDSFRAIHDLGTSAQEMRRIVTAMAGLLAAYEVTTFLLGEYCIDDVDRYPEFAVVDGIVQLARQPLTTRDERYFRVLKLRGSAYQEGQHAFRITRGGLELFPRLVSPKAPKSYEPVLERIPTGVSGLDALLGGGLWRGSSTLAIGPTGSGKTILALQFALEGVRRGEGSLYVHFQENPSQLRRTIDSLGMNAREAEERGLKLLYWSAVELQIDSIIVGIFEQVRRGHVRRLVVDAVGDLATAANDAQRLHDYLYALVQYLAVHGVTGLMTFESAGDTGAGLGEAGLRFSYLADNVVALGLRGEERLRRTVRLVKARNSAHDLDIREFEIDRGGIRIA